MPDHLRPITIEIPPPGAEQALAVWGTARRNREKIWIRYSSQMQELMAEEQRCADAHDGDAGSWNIDF